MKFLVDMPLSPALAVWLNGKGHDAVHAGELGLHRAPDSEIFSRARPEQRTIVTADLDYPRLLAMSRTVEPSLILFRDGQWSETEITRRMQELLEAMRADDIAGSIVVVDKSSMRRRRLPLP